MDQTQVPDREVTEELAAGELPRRGLGLRGRVLGAILVVALTTVGVGAFGIQRMGVLSDQAQKVYDEGAVPVDALRELEVNWWELSAFTARANIPTLPAESRASSQQKAGVAAQALAENTAAAADLPMSDETRAAYEEFAGAAERYLGLLQQLVAGTGTLTPAQMMPIITEMNTQETTIEESLVTATGSATATARATAAEARAAYETARTLTLVMMVAGLLTSVVLAVLVARSVTRPVQRIREILGQVAGGDLTVRAGRTGGAELGEMAASLDETLASIGTVLVLVSDSSTRLAAASTQLHAAAEGMRTNAETAAGQADEVVASAGAR